MFDCWGSGVERGWNANVGLNNIVSSDSALMLLFPWEFLWNMDFGIGYFMIFHSGVLEIRFSKEFLIFLDGVGKVMCKVNVCYGFPMIFFLIIVSI